MRARKPRFALAGADKMRVSAMQSFFVMPRFKSGKAIALP
jgi:hypothetical protein